MHNKILLITVLLLSSLQVTAQEKTDTVKNKDGKFVNESTTLATANNIGVERVHDSIFILSGRGGNIGVFIGEDGILMIDSQFAKTSPQLLQRVRNLSSKPIEILVNTHHHGDHIGGNSAIADVGALVFSHQNARTRMEGSISGASDKEGHQKQVDSIVATYGDKLQTEEDKKVAIANAEQIITNIEKANIPKGSLPVVSFEKNITFNFNGEKIKVIHLYNAHTDGDVMVYFTKSNVLHTGDAFFNGAYPYIDTKSDGSLKGYVGGLNQIVSIVNEDTKIIPGHGEIANIDDVKYTLGMFRFLTAKVEYHVISKKTEAEVAAMRDLTKEYDDKGFGDGFITTEKFLKTLYNETSKKYQK